jgi:glycosyltransferase involved in cell wall biosynthesis
VIEVVALTSGRNVPSRRFRVDQHVAELARRGVRVSEFAPRIEKYAPVPGAYHRWFARLANSTPAKAAWSLPKLASRLPGIAGTWKSDITWLQREMLPGFATLEVLTKRPWVLDVDDAIWLTRPGASKAIGRLARTASVVMAGNHFLAGWCESQGASVRVVPTAVDTQRYRPGERAAVSEGAPLVVGWIGTSANFAYLRRIASPLASFLADSDAELLVVADRFPQLEELPPDRVRWQPWAPDTEVAAIQSMDIGLMPLGRDDWSEGKCALKMLQYLSCEVPTLVSSTAMTENVLSRGELGAAARSAADWDAGLRELRDDPILRRRRGQAGRRVVEEGFSQPQVAAMVAAVFEDLAGAS